MFVRSSKLSTHSMFVFTLPARRRGSPFHIQPVSFILLGVFEVVVQRSLQSIRGQGKSHECRFHFSADFILFYVEKQVHTLSLTSHYYFLGSPWCSCGASFGIGLAVSISYPLLPFLEHLGLHLSLMKLRKWLVIPFKFFAEFNMPRVRWYFWSVFVYSIKLFEWVNHFNTVFIGSLSVFVCWSH